jgi:nucleoid-associated protein YgaU
MINPLQAVLGFASSSPAFDAASRYSGLPLSTLQTPAGPVAYVTRRFLPRFTPAGAVQYHTVVQGERLDTIAARYFGDPTQFWRICDANDALLPEDLTATPGTVLSIPSVQGIAGAPFV